MDDIINRTPREFREKYEELWTDKDSFNLGASQQEEPNPFDVYFLLIVSQLFLILLVN